MHFKPKIRKRKKTDTYDALRIAVAHRDGRLKPFVCCTREQYALRKALRDAQKEQQEVRNMPIKCVALNTSLMRQNG